MRLFVFDIDGTLIPRGGSEISPIDLASIHKLLENGDAVAIASGRPFCSIRGLIDLFGEGKHKYLIGANGAASFDQDGNPISDSRLSLDVLYHFYERFKDMGVFVYGYDTRSGLVIYEEGVCTDLEVELCHIKRENFHFVPKEGKPEGLEIPLYKVILAAEPEVSRKIKLTDEELETYTSNRSDPCFIEILAKGSDKGYRVEKLREYLGVKKEDVYCFGDAGNDFTMIRDNFGIAMGNGFDEIKKVAKYVTTDVKEQGVTHALKHLGFID